MPTRQKLFHLSMLILSFVLLSPLLLLLRPVDALAADRQLAAVYTHGTLSLEIPYTLDHTGPGKLTVEVLDPDDHVLARGDRNVDAVHEGLWKQDLKLDKPLPLDDIVWERVRYRFTFTKDTDPAIEQTRSISEILRRPFVHLIGQTSYFAGSQAAVRIVLTDADNQPISGNSTVRVDLVADHGIHTLFSGRLNRRGTTEAQFHLPAGLVGSYQLHIVAQTPLGSTETTQTIRLEDRASILLTTEKPIYQPGQTIHVRALALNRADHHATTNSKTTFELEDSRGNKVFKKITSTDAFGIASAEFQLADEVNLGTYHLRALMGDGPAPATTAEIALNVEKYVLPKFKVAIDFSKKGDKPKLDYRPGDHVTGTIQANYFFGKPVSEAEITLKASSADVSVFEVSTITGKTDKDGTYHFDLKLPSYFAGRATNQGAARVLVEATVKDSAEHSETRGEPITVSQSSLLITAVPESGKLIPGLENQVYILTSYPDGTPAKTHLSAGFTGDPAQSLTTDSGGIAILRIKPESGASLHVEADDQHGSQASASLPLDFRSGADQILLRTNRSVYAAGDRIELNILSTKLRGSAYVDVVKDGQTILTRDLDIEDGHAMLSLAATPEMSGTLNINAYLFARDAEPIADHRLVFIQPANELHIEAVSDANIYKPGGEANLRFKVTNARGEGVSAALGVQIVDEAVFALAEKQPGFAKVFFLLEQEAMKPRYEIHSLSMTSVVELVNTSEEDQHDRAARALFAATEMVHTNQLNTEFGQEIPQGRQETFLELYRAAFARQIQRLATNINHQFALHSGDTDLANAFATLAMTDPDKTRDAWGTHIRVTPSWSRSSSERYFRITSAGPDRSFNTGDDLDLYVSVHVPQPVTHIHHSNGGHSAITLKTDHDRGPFDGRAQVSGNITDAAGASIPGASITLRSSQNPQDIRKTTATASGSFLIAAIPAGKYQVDITATGFNKVSRSLTLDPRDLAQLTATLASSSASVTITADDGSVNEDVITSAAVMDVANMDGLPGPVRLGAPMRRGMPPPPVMAMAAPAPVNMGGGMHGMVAASGAAAKVPMSVLGAVDSLEAKARNTGIAGGIGMGAEAPAEAAPHVRSYFPEALYINPEILTDANGLATITIPVADSITTWRMAMLASNQSGALGTASSSLKVFQDFFVDLDLPVTLTQGDRVSIPVAIYNYAGDRGDVSLMLQPEDWFTLVNDDPNKSLSVDANQVGSSQYTIQANRIGKFKLTLSARMKGSANRQDIVVREIEVVPNGHEENIVFNGHLDKDAQHTVSFPASSIPEASKLFVRLYPGPLSQVIEGMDSILRMPGGCFEQTSSSTYPNVLALDYMKRTNKLTPEVHAKAEGYIANGYQRLLTFEVPGGGFSWFGQAPANKILTAYGLMEFADMAKVYDVDPRVIERTGNWLAALQQPDGSWKPDTQFINEGVTNRFNTDRLRITAYIAWSLANTGYRGPALEKAKQYIAEHLDDSSNRPDAYTLAVLANFATDYAATHHEADRDLTNRIMQLLLDAKKEDGDKVYWTSAETGVYSTGTSATIETTGLAAQALLKWGQASPIAREALNYITSTKQAAGNWGTTQATIMALRALLMASESNASDVRGTASITLNGKVVQTLQLNADNNDLFHQFVLPGIAEGQPNDVAIHFSGTGGLAYQVVGRYFEPWARENSADVTHGDVLTINVAYDRTHLAQNDIATATATIHNNLGKTANMVMVDLGIPPGFDLLSEDLQDFQEKSAGSHAGRLEKFSMTATQAILYFDALAPNQTVTLHFRLRAKYPIRAKTFQSRVYEYYDPAISAIAVPVQLEVK